MSAIRRPTVVLPPAPAQYNQKEQNEFRRILMNALGESVQDINRPSLSVTTTPATTDYTIVVTWIGTMTYTIDGGAVTAGTTSPQTIVVTRNAVNGATKNYVFSVVNNAQTSSLAVAVPAEVFGGTLSISACEANDAGSAGPPYNQLEIPFTYSGMPTGTVFDVSYNNGVAGGVDSDTGIAMTTSPQTKIFTSVTFGGAPGSGAVTVTARSGGLVLATAVRNKAYTT